MGSLGDLRHSRVFLDTSPFIYFVERHPKYLALLRPFFEALSLAEIDGVTSTITLTEVMVHPFRHGDLKLAELYRTILSNSAGLDLRPISAAVAETAASLRANFQLKTPDALQLATAIDSQASVFLTNDLNLPDLTGIRCVVLDVVLASP